MSRLKRDLLLLGLAIILTGVAILMVAPRALAIDEVIDNYSDASKVNVTYQVIHNSTLGVMELNFTRDGLGPPMDIWTTGGFTEVEQGGDHLKNINGTHIWFDNVDRNDGDRIFKDFGVNYFDVGFHYFFRVRFDSYRISNPRAYFMVFSEENLDIYHTILNSNNFAGFFIWWNTPISNWELQLRMFNSTLPLSGYAIDKVSTADSLDLNKWYHVEYVRSGDNITAWFYNNALMTDLDFMLTLDVKACDNLRYFHPLNAEDQLTGGRAMDLNLNRVRNFTAIGEYVLSGYFTTTNFMTGLNENITVVLLNSTIPQGSINLEWSSDGSAWTDLGPLSTYTWSEDLRGFESEDAIYRFNFTRGADPQITPRLYQVRTIHEGVGNGTGPCANVTGAWIEYNFTSIITLTGTNASTGGNWLNQTYWLDSYQYNVTEVVGAPGYDIRFNITGLPDGLICLQIVGFMAYDGSAGHTFNVQAYNYTSSAWVIISDIPDTSKTWINGTIDCEPDDFIQGGLFQGRYYHTSPGNVNHHWCLDYAKLRAFSPTPCPVTPTPTVSGVTYLTYALAVILLLLGLMIGSRMRR